MSNLEKFRKWMSDQGESAIYIGDGKFEGYVANKMYDAFCGALAAPSIASSAPADDVKRFDLSLSSRDDDQPGFNRGTVESPSGDWVRYRDHAAAIAAQQAAPAAILVDALNQIALWELPETGKTWPSGGAISYEAEYGSNGARDYIRQVAFKALAAAGILSLPVP